MTIKKRGGNKSRGRQYKLGYIDAQIWTDEEINRARQIFNQKNPNNPLRLISEYSTKELAITFLKLVGVGLLVMVALSGRPPSMFQIYKIFQADNRKDKDRLGHMVRRYKRRGLVRLKDGRLMTTADGDRLLDTYRARNLYFKPPLKWDGQWYMVVFDVPGKYENERKILREKLSGLGFRKYQDSIFISPYNCTHIINKLKKYLALDSYVKSFIVSSLDIQEENRFKKLFKLD